MTEENAFIASINAADDSELLAELRASFLKQPFRRYDFGMGFPVGPFVETLGLRGSVATFRSQFRGDVGRDIGLARDRRLAVQLPGMGLNECYYGAASYPVHPFLCEFSSGHHPMTAKDVLAALHVRDFRSDHMLTLDAPRLPFPGYHPGTDNDEVHNDFAEQNIFGHERPGVEALGHHGVLRRYVEGKCVWYLLLHTWRRLRRGPIVTLLAVGRSPHGQRLIGVVTHQMCHNLCD